MDAISITICIVYAILHLLSIVWICQEANNRECASAGKAFVFTFFFSLFAGLLYLSLFPRKKRTSIIEDFNKTKTVSAPEFEDFMVGDALKVKNTGEVVTLESVQDKGAYNVYYCSTENGKRSFYRYELIKA